MGGGYKPKEQGRGEDEEGADMLSRISLAMMYRAARLAGVPLKLEDAPAKVKKSFTVDAALITAFNAYLLACGVEKDKDAKTSFLHEMMEDQHHLYIYGENT
ncbi:hypothetical protein BH11PSE12_BH11PSE12_22250 [soil metagenome]